MCGDPLEDERIRAASTLCNECMDALEVAELHPYDGDEPVYLEE